MSEKTKTMTRKEIHDAQVRLAVRIGDLLQLKHDQNGIVDRQIAEARQEQKQLNEEMVRRLVQPERK